MKINKQNAMKLWRSRYGDDNDVCDYAGRPMFFLDYNKRIIQTFQIIWRVRRKDPPN